MINRRFFSEFDWITLLIVVALSGIGIVFIYSATRDSANTFYLWRQVVWLASGLILFVMVLMIDYHTLADYAHFFYGFALLFLLAVLVFGKEVHGNKSWFRIAGMSLQPSEFVKIAAILALASFFSRVTREQLSLLETILAAAIAFIPTLLVLLQGDLGSAMTFAPIFAALAVVCGVKKKLILITLLAVLCLAPLGWISLKEYQRQRIRVTFNPELDPRGIGYQAQQSRIAIGSGGLLGKGLFRGTQSQLGFLPARHTDFIFSVLVEETGLMGALVVLGLYFWLLWRIFNYARTARDRLGMLLIVGVASLITFHIFINVGMDIGVMPIAGIPLPFLSFGGSSMMATFIGMGLIMNVQVRRFFY
ncbi:MAG TPA: rod shape-determining protein RodA [Acidobacteriota bacterium]|jgi:rod shape determining protein RodA